MLAFAARRLAHTILVLLAATGIVFVALFVAVDPVRTMLPIGTPDAQVEATRQAMGFADPLVTQYLRYLGNMLQGDFGTSLVLRTDALEVTLARLPMTALIVAPATLIGVVVGGALGLLAGTRPRSKLDRLVGIASYGGLSIAEFWLGIMLITLFAATWQLLPSGGYNGWKSLVLPVAVLTIRPLAQTAQVMRASVIEESRRDYTLTALSKGLSERSVALRHWLRNASIPVVTLSLYNAGRQFVGAAVAVEVIFSWPGMGRLVVDALQRGDIFVVQAVVVVSVLIVVFLNLLADVLYFVIDPRTRSAAGRA